MNTPERRSDFESLPRHKLSIVNQQVKKKPVHKKDVPSMKYRYLRAKKTGKDMYVSVEYFHEGEWHRRKIRKGINRLPIGERKEAVEDLRLWLEQKLDAGLNLVTGKYESDQIRYKPISEALEFAFEKKKEDWTGLSEPTRRSCLNAIKSGISAADMNLNTGDLRRSNIMQILDQAQKLKGYGNRRYNAVLEVFRTLFAVLLLWDDGLEYNPARDIPRKKYKPQYIHAHPTDEQLDKIAKHLKENCRQLHLFCKIILRTGIRPAEICSIKIRDLRSDGVELIPENPNSKKKHRYVSFDEDLMSNITKEIQDADHYLFSTDLQPGPVKLHKSYVGRYWNKYVRKDLNIGCTMYSLKGTGGDLKRMAGISREAVQRSFGHSDFNTTKIYLTQEDRLLDQELRSIVTPF